jgi:hypothetical protein
VRAAAGCFQWHPENLLTRLISDDDLIARNITRVLVSGKVLGHSNRLLHGIDKRRQRFAVVIHKGYPPTEVEIERWHARDPYALNLSETRGSFLCKICSSD